MLIHVVMWKYKDETTQVRKFEHLSMLKALPEAISSIKNFEVGNDIIHLERSYDTALVAVFEDRQGLEEYTVHEQHQRVAEIGKEISAHVASVDFLVG